MKTCLRGAFVSGAMLLGCGGRVEFDRSGGRDGEVKVALQS